MKLSCEEHAQRQRLDELYVRAQSPIMLSIERRVCGCDFGAISWTTRPEAERIAALLELGPGRHLLDLGAGSGWPGLYMAVLSGCDVMLVDLPLSGLRIASERARKDRMRGNSGAVVADAATLPFPHGSFDAVSHSDLLCCLRHKRAVLKTCRRVTRNEGRMVFTVISIAPGLSPEKHKLAAENGPEFIESDTEYSMLLRETGWSILDHQDLTMDFAASCRRQLQADEEYQRALESLVGPAEYDERQNGWRSKLAVIADGLLRRELFVAAPDGT
jgi:cyclopropane fatty-acyl-phospholipid synthase-like methyltransferase